MGRRPLRGRLVPRPEVGHHAFSYWSCRQQCQVVGHRYGEAAGSDRHQVRGAYVRVQLQRQHDLLHHRKQMGHPCEINVVDAKNFSADAEPIMKIPIPANGPKVSAMIWSGMDDTLLTGHDNGDIVQWDLKTSKKVQLVSDHAKAISDMQPNVDSTMFISSSKDNTAKLYDSDPLTCKKEFKTERPVNSASISPQYHHVVLGGGQDAMEVTTTSSKVGKFDARFFHLVFEEEFGRIKGHFGPINSVMFHPDGKGYASGGEDGYVRVHEFDESYFDFKFDF